MSLTETLRSEPGFVFDMYMARRAYDDEQHGLRRKRECEWSED